MLRDIEARFHDLFCGHQAGQAARGAGTQNKVHVERIELERALFSPDSKPVSVLGFLKTLFVKGVGPKLLSSNVLLPVLSSSDLWAQIFGGGRALNSPPAPQTRSSSSSSSSSPTGSPKPARDAER